MLDGGGALGSSNLRFPSPERKAGLRPCEVRGCPKKTHDYKDFCLEHVEEMPYVHRLLAEMSSMTRAEVLGDSEALLRIRVVEVELPGRRLLFALLRDGSSRVRPITSALPATDGPFVSRALGARRLDLIPRDWLVRHPPTLRLARRFLWPLGAEEE